MQMLEGYLVLDIHLFLSSLLIAATCSNTENTNGGVGVVVTLCILIAANIRRCTRKGG